MGAGFALVTGGAAGIGRAVAERLAAGELRLVLWDRDEAALERAVAELGSGGRQVEGMVVDVAREEAVVTAMESCCQRLGPPRAVVNNAGIGLQRPLLSHTLDDFHRIFAVNLFGLFAVLREAARRLVAAGGGGRLVNLASVAGLRGSVGRAAYGASKAAVVNLTQVAAVELARHGIAVNAVAPGPVETPLVQVMHTPATRAAWLRHVPAGRYGEPGEVAEVVAWLATRAPRWLTGQVLAVDGGFAAGGLLFEVAGEEAGTALVAEDGKERPEETA